ncbi:hypothetical protein [Methanosarcina sp.]|uniref:hypothetical protein n=1 Tax=Methanosarcina sp. TaxID=2213 RepID=UPI002ABC106D|nr:hypothetical protein [Methanosarcina sp.]MDY9928119.1 hypothetical protein [Methanosarcina sp.]
MVKLTYVFILSILIFWLAGSGCIGDDTSEIEGAGIVPNIPGTEDDTSAEQGLTEAEIQEFEEKITDLEALLENSSLEEEIVVEEL